MNYKLYYELQNYIINYVAEIQSTCIPDEQLVNGDMMYPSTYTYPDTSCSSGIHVSGRHVSWCKRGITTNTVSTVHVCVCVCVCVL